MPYLQRKIKRLDLQTNISSAIQLNNQQFTVVKQEAIAQISISGNSQFYDEHGKCGVMPDDAELCSNIQSDFNSMFLLPDKCEVTRPTGILAKLIVDSHLPSL